MNQALVAGVRRFNRTVTQRVGALEEHYLGRARALGADRVLWEIGRAGGDGCEVRRLRARLDLDSGYLSRLLRVLEEHGLIVVGRADTDRRVRLARLTADGTEELALLDRQSDELAASFLAPLQPHERERLVDAMRQVERLLMASAIAIAPVDPMRPDAQHCLRAYFAELDERFDAGFDPTQSISADAPELRPPNGVLLLVSLHAEPIGCGALKFRAGAPTEVKRMWIAPSARGAGIGRRLLDALESYARRHGSRVLRLETNASLTEAIAMYRAAGFVEVEPFNDEPYAHHWFEKRLDD
jgi:DNA-binding MarR family transcriptional regulator